MSAAPDKIPLSVADWEALEPLPMRSIAGARETGTIYMVNRVAVMPARSDELRAAGIVEEDAHGMTPLPTVTVETTEGARLYRLPVELNGWAFDIVALAQAQQLSFPCEVEFGFIQGRPYADFVLSESRLN